MKLALINDTDGRENIGCRLTSSRLKQTLHEAALRQEVSLEITSCSWKFNKSSTPALPRTSIALGYGSSTLTPSVLRELSIAEYGKDAVNVVEVSEAVLYQPEGSISDDNNAFRVLRQICLPLYARIALQKPLIIANGTFPLFNDFRRNMLETLVSLAERVYFRDRLSAEHFGGNFCPDAAVTWPGQPVCEDISKRPYLLITTAAHASVEADRALCFNALKWCERHDTKPLILTKGWERLEIFRDTVRSQGGRFIEYATLNEADKILDEVRLHVGGRYHMAILCATKGIPSRLVISNTHKNAWLSEDFSGITIMDGARDEIDTLAKTIFTPKEITDSVKIQVQQFEERATSIIQDIKNCVQSGPSKVDRQDLFNLWASSSAASEFRADYFRDSAKVMLRATGLMKPPKDHDLPT